MPTRRGFRVYAHRVLDGVAQTTLIKKANSGGKKAFLRTIQSTRRVLAAESRIFPKMKFIVSGKLNRAKKKKP